MKITHEPSTLIERERTRMQITLQIDEFLRRGGEISVVTCAAQSSRGGVACGWRDQDDFPQLTQ